MCTKVSLSKRTPEIAVLECLVTSEAIFERKFLWYWNGIEISSYNASKLVFYLSGNTLTVILSSDSFGDYSCRLVDDTTASECNKTYTLGKVRYTLYPIVVIFSHKSSLKG